MQLLVLPDPHQGLTGQGASIVAHLECGHPAGNRLLPVGDSHDLLALERQQEEALALRPGTPGELDAPPVEQPLHVIEEGALQVPRRRSGVIPGRSSGHEVGPPE